MPWSVQKRESKWCVVKEGGDVEGCHASRTDAIKHQRALYSNESRMASMYAELDERVEEVVEEIVQEVALPVYNGNGSRTGPIMPALDGNPKVDQRLQAAMELIAEFTQEPPQPHPIHVTVENDNSGMQALVAALGQITERLMNGEKVSESLVASLQNLAEQAPPVVNVEVESPVVNVPAPIVNVPAANITVHPEIFLPEQEKRVSKVTMVRDPFGKLEGAEITEE